MKDMSIDKNKRGNKYDQEHREYKRDTICAIIVMAVLFLSPIGITLFENHQAALREAQMQQELEALLASPSEATPSDAAASDAALSDDTLSGTEAEGTETLSETEAEAE